MRMTKTMRVTTNSWPGSSVRVRMRDMEPVHPQFKHGFSVGALLGVMLSAALVVLLN